VTSILFWMFDYEYDTRKKNKLKCICSISRYVINSYSYGIFVLYDYIEIFPYFSGLLF
jgi:hypothetical protein